MCVSQLHNITSFMSFFLRAAEHGDLFLALFATGLAMQRKHLSEMFHAYILAWFTWDREWTFASLVILKHKYTIQQYVFFPYLQEALNLAWLHIDSYAMWLVIQRFFWHEFFILYRERAMLLSQQDVDDFDSETRKHVRYAFTLRLYRFLIMHAIPAIAQILHFSTFKHCSLV
jgi:hypothetical protein